MRAARSLTPMRSVSRDEISSRSVVRRPLALSRRRRAPSNGARGELSHTSSPDSSAASIDRFLDGDIGFRFALSERASSPTHAKIASGHTPSELSSSNGSSNNANGTSSRIKPSEHAVALANARSVAAARRRCSLSTSTSARAATARRGDDISRPRARTAGRFRASSSLDRAAADANTFTDG